MKILVSTKTSTRMFIKALPQITQSWRQPQRVTRTNVAQTQGPQLYDTDYRHATPRQDLRTTRSKRHHRTHLVWSHTGTEFWNRKKKNQRGQVRAYCDSREQRFWGNGNTLIKNVAMQIDTFYKMHRTVCFRMGASVLKHRYLGKNLTSSQNKSNFWPQLWNSTEEKSTLVSPGTGEYWHLTVGWS